MSNTWDLQFGGQNPINEVLASPASGAAGPLTVRALVSADMPSSGAGSGTVTNVTFTGGLISVATSTTTPALTVAGTSGGVVYFNSATTWSSSALLPLAAVMLGGGAGGAPRASFALSYGVVGSGVLSVGTVGDSIGGKLTLSASSAGTITLSPSANSTILNCNASIQLISSLVYQINGDTGLSRLSAGAWAMGNGTNGDFSGSLTLTGLSVHGTLTDGSASVGTSGQVLSSTVTGVKWVAVTASAIPWSSITNATAALTLNNTGYSTTFQQNATDVWTWGLASYTAGVSNSPSLVLAGSYESASTPTYAQDKWTIQDVVGSGVNGTSILTIAHIGTTSIPIVSMPSLQVTWNGSVYATGSAGDIVTARSASSGAIFFGTSGAANHWYWDGSSMYLGTGNMWYPTGTTLIWNADSSISRLSPGVFAVGNGTSGDTSGRLIGSQIVASYNGTFDSGLVSGDMSCARSASTGLIAFGTSATIAPGYTNYWYWDGSNMNLGTGSLYLSALGGGGGISCYSLITSGPITCAGSLQLTTSGGGAGCLFIGGTSASTCLQIGNATGASVNGVGATVMGIAQANVAWLVAIDTAGNIGCGGVYTTYLKSTGNGDIAGFLRVGGGTGSTTTGDITIGRSATTGALFFGTSAAQYHYWDGTNMNQNLGNFLAPGTIKGATIQCTSNFTASSGSIGTTHVSAGWSVGTITNGLVVAFTATSDARLKTNITPFERGLADVIKINPVSFNWNDEAYDHADLDRTARQYGFIAQDVEKAIPEAVGSEVANALVVDEETGNREYKPSGKEDYKTLNDKTIMVAMLNSIKELSAKNDALTARIAALEEKLKP